MCSKLAGLRLIKINGDDLVLARRTMPMADVREFYERTEEIAVVDSRLVGFFDRPNEHKKTTYADVVEQSDIDLERLPVVL